MRGICMAAVLCVTGTLAWAVAPGAVALPSPSFEQGAGDNLFLSLIAFGLEADTTFTQVLFFKFQSNQVRLQNHSGKVSIDTNVLAAIRDDLSAKLAKHAGDFIRGLDI